MQAKRRGRERGEVLSYESRRYTVTLTLPFHPLSNQFHATCLDTYPPIFYMNDTSKSVIKIVHAYNAWKGRVAAAYTFDAGPNAVIYCLDDVVDEVRLHEERNDELTTQSQVAKTTQARTSVQDAPPP